MRALACGLAAAVLCSVGPAGAGEAPAKDARGTPSASFVPGPPLWRPPSDRLRPTVKTTDLGNVIDQCVTDAMAAANTPGASVAVIVDGELVYERGYGVKRRGGSAAVNAGTQFRIGSITKMFTAAAVMQQVEAGTVFLDDPLTRYVPEVEFLGHWPAEEITVERLLTHATGIPDLAFNRDGPAGADALSDWVATLDQVGLHCPPGAFYNYSNPNFNFAGLVVESASGMDYRSYMEDRIFDPAGLADTTFDPAAVVARGNASYGHTPDGEDEIVYAPDDYDNGAFAPAGYAFSTAGDLVRWALLLSDGGGDVLSPGSAAAMQRLQRSLDIVPGMGYGYGIFVEPFYDLTVRQHGGNIWGWGAFLLWRPEERFAVAVLANTFQSLPGAAYCVAAEVLDPDFGVVVDPAPPDVERWQRLFESTLEASINTGWAASSPYPIRAQLATYDEDQMLLQMWDPESSWAVFWMADHQIADLFYVDVDMDGSYDLNLTLLTSPGPPESLRWMRMRPVVGYPQRDPRTGAQDRH